MQYRQGMNRHAYYTLSYQVQESQDIASHSSSTMLCNAYGQHVFAQAEITAPVQSHSVLDA
jgi:hypothetical protein